MTFNKAVFAFEDIRLDSSSKWNDRDYNDLVFRIGGAFGSAVNLNSLVATARDWCSTTLGPLLLQLTQ